MNSYTLMESASAGPVLLITCPPSSIPMQLTPIIAPTSANITPPPSQLQMLDPMEALWHSQFDQLFTHFWPFTWRLIPRPLIDCKIENWHTHSDSAKVRFLCQVCNHGWTSMKGRVMFWYQFNPITLCGTVAFALYGQKCQECSKNGLDIFTPSMWYQEEVVKVLLNVYNRVGQTFYGFQQPSYIKIRRQGKPRSQHASELCQACQMGVCSASNLRKDEIEAG